MTEIEKELTELYTENKTMKSRMFEGLRTWNPYFGCQHRCYKGGCWAKKRLAHRLGKMLDCQLCYDFVPHLHSERLNRVPSDPKIFVVAHGDLFGYWVSSGVIHRILNVCREIPKEVWFFETKNPRRYAEFADAFPSNTVLSTTIETNRQYSKAVMGYAPSPLERLRGINRISHKFPIHVSIEPIMDFDLNDMVAMMKFLQPIKVAVGYDSLNNGLPEPPKEKTLRLIKKLEEFTEVERKQL